MAWNPSFSFKLRDDEITFGTLIFDKSCAELLCEELLRIKQDGPVNINNIRAILENGCFTDSELDSARNELELIKTDIVEFKQLLSVKQRFEAWYENTATTGAYVIGSQSWYQYYTNLKMMAADMYFKLVSSGEQFEPNAKAGYESRYGEVLKQSSAKERTELALRRQFDENVANGIPNAREIYCEAMMVAGLMSKEQVDAQNKLFRAANSSEVETTILSKSTVYANKLIDSLWLEVESHADMFIKSLAISKFFDNTIRILNDINVILDYSNLEEKIKEFFKTQDIKAGDLYKEALLFKGSLSEGNTYDELASTTIGYSPAVIDEMIISIRNISKNEYQPNATEELLDVDKIIKLYNEVFTIPDAMKKALIITELASSTIKILKSAEIACSGLWEESIEEFLKGTGSAGTMVELAETLKNVLSFEANKNIINSYDLSEKDFNYSNILRQINEAQFK